VFQRPRQRRITGVGEWCGGEGGGEERGGSGEESGGADHDSRRPMESPRPLFARPSATWSASASRRAADIDRMSVTRAGGRS
jgi:hypothetical protein